MATEKLMTTDDLFAKIQAEGFYGYSPAPNDIFGDCWARKIGDEFDRVAVDLPAGRFRHTVWLLWQWLYCELAGVRSKIIASPPALRAANIEVGPKEIDAACRLLLAAAE